MTDKTDFKQELDAYRATPGELRTVAVPELRYLMVDGHGDPDTAAYAHAVEALYPVAYALKFASKRELGRDYVVMPLEGLWWAEDMAAFTTRRDTSRWEWTLMMMVPDWIDQDRFDAAVRHTGAKRRPDRLADVRLQALSEGVCVQTLHVGPYDDEAEVIARMHESIAARSLTLVGKHHEVYLSDARKVAPDRLRTILRQPVRA